MTIPIVMTSAGATPATPSALNAELIALAVASNPGLTANLPGTLIEDIASTDTAALVLIDAAQVETVNSMTPYGANLFELNQLGQIYGVQQGKGTNTAVYVVFSGTAGQVIGAGVIVSDGVYTYVTQAASIINSTGMSNTVYCVASQSGSWAVPANTVTIISSSVPPGVTLTVNNPNAGIPSSGVQDPGDYRSQVLNAGLSNPSGTPTAIKSALANVPGVIDSLISVKVAGYYNPDRFEVIVGGGDPTAIAGAIFNSCGDPNSLGASVMQVATVTTGTTTTIVTNLVTGFTTGESVVISGATGITGINGTWTITTVSGNPFAFTISYNSSGTYTGGGVVTVGSTGTIPRNVSVTVYDQPDSYVIPFVIPPQQPVLVQITWNTTSTNVVSNSAIQTLSTAPVQAYINGLGPGQPINIYELQYVFQQAVVSLIPTPLLTHIAVQVTLNGVVTPPISDTGIILGDPEGYYYVSSTGVTTVRG